METPFRIAVGDITLEGLLSLPSPAPKLGVVVCHPHPLRGGEMRNPVVASLVEAFRDAGLATLRFNFRGVEGSSGQHNNGVGEIDDVIAAVDALVAHAKVSAVAIAGYSFGAWVGLKAGAGDARVQKLVGVALPIASRDADYLLGTTKPTLLITGDRDDYCPLPKLKALAGAMANPASLVVLPGEDHFFRADAAAVGAAAAEFVAGTASV